MGLGGVLVAVAALLAVLGSGAFGAGISSASFAGSTGTVTSGGTLYAKAGQTVTLTVNTSASNDAKCVQLSGAHTAIQTSANGKSTWTFGPFTMGSGDGVKTVTITAGEGTNNPGTACTTKTTTTSASYVLDNTGPTVTGKLTPAPNGAGWNKSAVGVAWSADDGTGVGVDALTPATDVQPADTP